MEHHSLSVKLKVKFAFYQGGEEFDFWCSPPAISQRLHRTALRDLSIIPAAQRKGTGTHMDLSIILSAI